MNYMTEHTKYTLNKRKTKILSWQDLLQEEWPIWEEPYFFAPTGVIHPQMPYEGFHFQTDDPARSIILSPLRKALPCERTHHHEKSDIPLRLYPEDRHKTENQTMDDS